MLRRGLCAPSTSRCRNHTNSNWGRSKAPYSAIYKSQQWVELRRRVLREEPTCAVPGCQERATAVDHIVSLGNGGDPYDRGNLRGMCYPHHSKRSSQQGAEAKKRNRNRKEQS